MMTAATPPRVKVGSAPVLVSDTETFWDTFSYPAGCWKTTW